MEQTIDWNGDGRYHVSPPADAPGQAPTVLRLGSARLIVGLFRDKGESNHGALGSTVWVVVDYCLAHNIPHEVITYREDGQILGYTVKRREPQA